MRSHVLVGLLSFMVGCDSLSVPISARLARNSPEQQTVSQYYWPEQYDSWAMDQAYSAVVRYDWNSAMINFRRALNRSGSNACHRLIAHSGLQAAEATKRSGHIAFAIETFDEWYLHYLGLNKFSPICEDRS